MTSQAQAPMRRPVWRTSFAWRAAALPPVVAGVLFAWLVAGATSPVRAGGLHDIPVEGYVLHRTGPIGAQGWGAVDVDDDGRMDLITSADGPASLLLVYGRIGPTSTLGLKQRMLQPPGRITALATIASGPHRLVTIGPDRVATLFGGWPLQEKASFQVVHDTTLARVDDIDADGILELICAGAGKLSAYVLPGGAPKWSMTVPVTDFVVASLDSDAAHELAIAGGDDVQALVLDGATLVAEWTRPEGIGTHVAAGDFSGSAQPGLVTARDWMGVEGFSAAPYASLWTIPASDTDVVAAGDTDADGQDEFAIGDGQWGSIRIHDGQTRQVLYELHNRGHGLWAAGFVDFDTDARRELFYSARIERSSDRSANFAAALMDPINARSRLTIESYWQGASSTVFADLDRDGRLDWAIGTFVGSAPSGLLRVVDAETRSETWRAPYEFANGFEPFQMGYRSLHGAQLDSDAALELVAVGGGYSGFRLLVLDGDSFSVERQVPPVPQRSFYEVSSSRLVQHVAGGNPELLVIGNSASIGAPSVNFKVLSLPEGQLQWQSPAMGGDFDRSLGLDVGQLDADPSPEYLAAHTAGLEAFDAATGVSEWRLQMSVSGARIMNLETGPAIFAFTSNGLVTVLDASTRLPLTAFSLPAPLESLTPIPARPDLLLAIADERLNLLRTDGTILAQSDWIGSAPEPGDNVHIVKEGRTWRIASGRSFATFQHRMSDPDALFHHGFE